MWKQDRMSTENEILWICQQKMSRKMRNENEFQYFMLSIVDKFTRLHSFPHVAVPASFHMMNMCKNIIII